MKREDLKTLGVVAVFAAAMAFLEAVVVIYIRRMFYDGVFSFPLKGFIEPSILQLEIVREFFTIVMLACIAILAAKKLRERFAYFAFAFAVWDIFYYIWLKIAIGWPSSFLTWDVLFLIPWTWIGPVLAPVIVSLSLIALSIAIIQLSGKKSKIKISLLEIAGILIGFAIIIYTFLNDYGAIVIQGKWDLIASYTPQSYNWIAFAIGEVIALASIARFYLRNKSVK